MATTILVIIVTLLLFSYFKYSQLSVIYSFSKDNLSQISYSSDYMLSSTKSLINEIYLDKDISKLMNYTNPDMYEILVASHELNSLSIALPFIHSIYIYNENADKFYTTLSAIGIKPRAQFFDQEVIGIMQENIEQNVLHAIPRRISIPQDEKSSDDVYTFISYTANNNKNGMQNAIIINISSKWMRETIDILGLDTSESIFVLDNLGTIINSSIEEKKMTNISSQDYIKKILSSDEDEGYFTAEVNGCKFLIIYVSSNKLDWKFVRILPYAEILTQLDNIKIYTMLIFIGIMFLGIILSFALSKRIYKPIDKVINKMSVDKNKYMYKLRQEFLANIVKGNSVKNLELYKDYQVKLNPENQFMMILFRIDHYNDFCEKYELKNRNRLKNNMIDIISEITSSIFVNETIDMKNDSILLLIESAYPFSRESVELQHAFDDMIKEIQYTIEECLDIALSCTISDKSCYLNELTIFYNNVLEASNYRLIDGYRCIIYRDKIKNSIKETNYKYPVKQEKAFVDALVLGNIDKAIIEFDKILESTKGYSYIVILSVVSKLVFSVNAVVNKIIRNGNLSISFDFMTFMNEINSMETLLDIRNHFFKIFSELKNKCEEKKSSKHDELVNHAIELIKNNYMDEDLSLQKISDHLKMSTVYFGRLFKKHTTKSVATYINIIRIEKTLELLTTTRKPINDISKQCGFGNENYFYYLFKKTYGVTPNQYRKNN